MLNRYELTARVEGLSPKTIANIKLAVGLFDKFLGGTQDVRKVQDDDLRQFILACQQKTRWAGRKQATNTKISDTTVNSYVRGIKSYWSWLGREKLIKTNPLASVPAPKLPKKLPRILSEQELHAIFAAIKGNARDIATVELLLDSGMRLGEIAGLALADIDLKAGSIRVYGKGKRERQTFISPQTTQTIEHYINHNRPQPRSEDRLLLTEEGYPLKTGRIQKRLEQIGKKAGLAQRLGPHKLRHTFATLSLKYGSNLEYVRRSLGHTRSTTTQVYLDVSSADVSEAHKKYSPVANLNLRGNHIKPTKKYHPLERHIITANRKRLTVVPPDSVEVVPLPPLK
ncbi:tyrosine-type recombinase/integrase [Chloroflexota bacterium]